MGSRFVSEESLEWITRRALQPHLARIQSKDHSVSYLCCQRRLETTSVQQNGHRGDVTLPWNLHPASSPASRDSTHTFVSQQIDASTHTHAHTIGVTASVSVNIHATVPVTASVFVLVSGCLCPCVCPLKNIQEQLGVCVIWHEHQYLV